MPPRKLSADDKLAIIDLYREPGQTTGTVAEQYGVSVSTISRLLKSELPSDEYDALVKQKRAGGKDSKKGEDKSPGSVRSRRTVKKSGTVKKSSASVKKKSSTVKKTKTRDAEPELEVPAVESTVEPPDTSTVLVEASEEVEKSEKSEKSEQTTVRRRRRRSRAVTSEAETVQLELAAEPEVVVNDEVSQADDQADGEVEMAPEVVQETVDESDGDEALSAADLAETNLTVVGDDDFADDFEDELEEEPEDEGEDEAEVLLSSQGVSDEQLEILPIGEADLARMFYLVIDRTADLITCPMQEFRDLGQVPATEEKLATLPIFDNHRIARRFSKRNQRVIKVPDGRILAKTAPWLEAKGITRCLLDGQVYSLETSS